ncbi:MFS transporter [Mesonia sp. K7]|uniref:MFS transporter n=1 Tax=Mesonia sp. K7 TaxID=2218606 RepID=UPI000DA7381F|nr:MFS transporter [Mesonia sp. K7]PZD79587.1 MFS transporter [Mesonia sp. K7]
MQTLPKGHKKLLHAWAFYDWANSVYNLVISSAIFPIFYGAITIANDEQGMVDFMGYSFNNDSLISYVTAFAFLTVSIISPVLSGIADYSGNKKFFLKLFCYLGSLSCIGLFWFNLDYIGLGLLCYYLALIGFWGSIVFYNSYLPDIAHKEQQDKISAKGYSLGYIGSVILLVLCLAMILMHETFGFENEGFPTRLSFILTGLWWMGFAQYSFKHLPKGNTESKNVTKKILFNGYRELKAIAVKIGQNLPQKRYLYAFFSYSMAVQTIMLIATYFGIEELNWGEQDATTGLIISILLIQLVAVLGATLTSKASAKWGNIPVLVVLNVIWVMICTYAFFIETPFQFYIAAAFVGLIMGGIQTLSRSTYSKLIPENAEDTASYFSFYDVAEKIGIVIGMATYGLLSDITGSVRNAIPFFIVFFILGIFFLFRVPKTAAISSQK